MLWEPSSTIGRYGTPLALMMLPYWTDGRISSMEGLYYESSATTPYHFLAAATLTVDTVERGARAAVPQLGRLQRSACSTSNCSGIRYYAAMPDMQQLAASNPALREVATVPDLDVGPPLGWKIYEVADSPVVVAIALQPVVARDLQADDNWKCEGKPEPRARTPGAAS